MILQVPGKHGKKSLKDFFKNWGVEGGKPVKYMVMKPVIFLKVLI